MTYIDKTAILCCSACKASAATAAETDVVPLPANRSRETDWCVHLSAILRKEGLKATFAGVLQIVQIKSSKILFAGAFSTPCKMRARFAYLNLRPKLFYDLHKFGNNAGGQK